MVYFTIHKYDHDYDKYYDTGLITWRFKDWKYYIDHCTPYAYSLKFTSVPPAEVNKIWDITLTADDVRIKCNKKEVLHFVYNNTYNTRCTTRVRNKEVMAVRFGYHDAAKKIHRPAAAAGEYGITLFKV